MTRKAETGHFGYTKLGEGSSCAREGAHIYTTASTLDLRRFGGETEMHAYLFMHVEMFSCDF